MYGDGIDWDDPVTEQEMSNALLENCPWCGEYGACAYDVEGRPLIHALSAEDDE